MRLLPIPILVLQLSTWLPAQTLPQFYWKLDESGGTIASDFMGQSDGLLQGNTSWQPAGGHHAGALRCYGNDARVDLGPCDLTGGTGDQLTLACWFKPEIMAGTERVLMAKTIGPNENDFIWSLSLVNSTGARFRVKCGGSLHTIDVPASSIFSNAWYHLTAVYDGSAMRMYLNGSLSATGTASGTLGFHPEAPATLGNVVTNSLPFYGALDDVRIYDQALTEAEVIELVIGDVMTGVNERKVIVPSGGRMTLPSGSWQYFSLTDTGGRPVAHQRIQPGAAGISLPTVPAGLYLVCLQGGSSALTCRVLVP